MAATNVYFSIDRVPNGAQAAADHVAFSNIQATTSPFTLDGGRYALELIGSTLGTVTLQRLGPDGSTYLTAATAFTGNGTALVDLPPSTYRVALA